MSLTIDIEPRKKTIQKGKYHIDKSDDPQIKTIAQKHKDDNTNLNLPSRITDDEIRQMLIRYSEDRTVDLATVADSLNIDLTTLHRVTHSDKWAEFYKAVQEKRGELFVQEGYKTACLPFDKIQKGEEVSMVEVASAKLKANYCFAYGKALNQRFDPVKEHGESGGIMVTVNTGVKLNI